MLWTVVLGKTLESPLDSKEIQQVNPKGNQPWKFIGRTDAEAEAPKFWPPDAKSQLTRKDPVAGKDWRQEEKGMTEDEMVGWHHWLYGHECEQALGDGEGQGSLACLLFMRSQSQTQLRHWPTAAAALRARVSCQSPSLQTLMQPNWTGPLGRLPGSHLPLWWNEFVLLNSCLLWT